MVTEKKTSRKKKTVRRTVGKKKTVSRTVKKKTEGNVRTIKKELPKTSAVKLGILKENSKRFKREIEEKQRTLDRCVIHLNRAHEVFRSPSIIRTLRILFIGFIIGVLSLLAFIYITKNQTLLKFFVGDAVVVLNGTSVLVETEIDKRFASEVEKNIPEKLKNVDLDPFWEVWQHIENDFISEPVQKPGLEFTKVEPPTREELIQGAIEGLTYATKDRHTHYFLPDDAKDFEERVIQGEITGIGAYISTERNELSVVSVIKNAPADNAGLQAKDIIREIDGVETIEYNVSEAAYAIRGKKGTTVNLKIFRPSHDETFVLPIVRDEVVIPTVKTEVRDGVFIIKLLTFNRATEKAFANALRKFVAEANTGGPDRILLDIRGNPGGVVSVAIYIAGLFLPERTTVLYEYLGDENLRAYKTVQPALVGRLPLVTILVDEGTASSSEILAAALQHYGIADIVGTNTMGKGSVQALKSIDSDKSLLKITVAHWLTPAKESISKIGVTPDVDYTEEIKALFENKTLFEDIEEYALDRAIKHLKSREE